MLYFDQTCLAIGISLLVIILIALRWRGKSISHLLFVSVFWIYLMGVVSLVVFPFPIGFPDPNFKPDINFIPFDFGYCDPRIRSLCIRNLYENILLTVPFGFGISFITRVKLRNIFWLAVGVGFVFELTQLIISIAIRSSFRVVDINDVILNATGVLLGYGVFRLFGALYSFITHKFQIRHRYIFAYIYDIVRQQ